MIAASTTAPPTAAVAAATAVAVPLCVDCDGTLLDTDLLHEALLLLVKQSPWSLLLLPWWLWHGKAYLKHRIAERVRFAWNTLPVCEHALEAIRAARAEQRPVVLATASPTPWAEAIARRIGLFDAVVATTEQVNLSGEAKAQRLVGLYGERGFDYVGNGRSDLPVWARCRRALVKSSRRSFIGAARACADVGSVLPAPAAGAVDYLKLIRVHQWLKNLLVFLPVIAAHRLGVGADLLAAVLAFVAFCLCASAVYLINDLLDLDADRQHVRKRRRPVASGRVPALHAILAAPLLLVAALAICAWLPLPFFGVLAAYFAATLAYSVRLKRQIVVDLTMLASLYTLRVIAGAAATAIAPSFWLLSFSMFLFFSLAVVKRYGEMRLALSLERTQAAGRGYVVDDLPVLLAFGVASGMAATLVIALYVNDADTRRLYADAAALWLVPPLVLYWTARVWMKAHRGEIDDDPVVFAVRDWQSLMLVGLIGACFFAATGWR